MRQILYISSSRPRGAKADLGAILEQSRHNNALDGVTGLLWSDGVRFLQVLEGPEESVETTYQRIAKDPRHQAIVVLSDKAIEARQFGNWSMAHKAPGEVDDGYGQRVERMLEGASDEVRQTFLGLIETRSNRA